MSCGYIAPLVLVTLASSVTYAGEEPNRVSDKRRLQGVWVFVSEKPSPDNPIENVTFEEDRIIFQDAKSRSIRADDGTALNSSFSLDPKQAPKHIDMTIVIGDFKSTAKGIYMIDGGLLTIIFSESGKPRPTEFKAHTGHGKELLVLKRKKRSGD